MATRAKLLKTIDAAYKLRMANDKEALAKHFAPRATFKFAAGTPLIDAVPSRGGNAIKSVNALIDSFTLKNMKRLNAVVEGNSAAVHWQVNVSTPSGKSAKTELYDLWTFNKQGRVTSMVQFGDSALLRSLL